MIESGKIHIVLTKQKSFVVQQGGEGLVVRKRDSFSYHDFDQSIAKFVRKDHVQTTKHWTAMNLTQNQLRKKEKNGNV